MPRHLLLAAALLAPASLLAAPVHVTRGVAAGGHDVVAYFTEGKPVKGSPDFTHEWDGATWHFRSAEHRDLFVEAPDAYAPRYGGFCAFGVSRGYAVGVDPEAFTIVDGRLYLNYSLDVRERWLAERDARIRKADELWPEVAAKVTR